MRKLVESTFVSLDGVISDPQKFGPPYWNDEHANYNRDLLFAADAMLLGRVTYEGFSKAWPPRAGKGDDFADRFNELPKYVASNTLQSVEWNATLLTGDVAAEIAALKQQPGQNIVKYGTGELDRTLLMPNKLVDEFHFWLFPVAVGRGDRLLDGIDMTHLKLAGTTTFTTGIVVLRYEPKDEKDGR